MLPIKAAYQSCLTNLLRLPDCWDAFCAALYSAVVREIVSFDSALSAFKHAENLVFRHCQ